MPVLMSIRRATKAYGEVTRNQAPSGAIRNAPLPPAVVCGVATKPARSPRPGPFAAVASSETAGCAQRLHASANAARGRTGKRPKGIISAKSGKLAREVDMPSGEHRFRAKPSIMVSGGLISGRDGGLGLAERIWQKGRSRLGPWDDHDGHGNGRGGTRFHSRHRP